MSLSTNQFTPVSTATPPGQPGRSRRRVLRDWRLWIVIAVVLAAGSGWALAINGQLAAQEHGDRVADLSRSNYLLREEVGAVTADRDQLQAEQSAVEDAAQELEDAVAKRETAVEKREAAARKRETTVKRRETAVTKAEQVQERNTITEGTWTVGVDVQPGSYRTKGTVNGDCYWEINSDANGNDIVANDIVTGGRPAVTLAQGQYFTTNGCGEWLKP